MCLPSLSVGVCTQIAGFGLSALPAKDALQNLRRDNIEGREIPEEHLGKYNDPLTLAMNGLLPPLQPTLYIRPDAAVVG